MLITLHPTYTIEIIIQDKLPVNQTSIVGASLLQSQGRKYFHTHKTGCDEVLKAVKEALNKAGIDGEIIFKKFEHRS